MAKLFWYDTVEVPAETAVVTVALPNLFASGRGIRMEYAPGQELLLAESLERAASTLRDRAARLAADPRDPPVVDKNILAPPAASPWE
jgi:hypothetical protein